MPNNTDDLRSRKFFPDVVAAAQDAEKVTGCPAAVALAQWALESGYGRYQMGAHNPFGMKWFAGCKYGSVSRFTKEFVKGQWITIEAKFQLFPDLKTAFIEHGHLLMYPDGPYKKALPFVKDWRKFVKVIGPVYATDPAYASKITAIIQDFSLFDFNV